MIVPVGWLEGLRTSHDTPTPDSLCLRPCLSLDQTPEITKTKGALYVVCTPTLKSILGLGNTKVSCKKLLCKLFVWSGTKE